MQEIKIRFVLIIRLCGLVEVRNELAEASSAVVGRLCRIRERVSILRVQIGFDVVVYSVILSLKTAID